MRTKRYILRNDATLLFGKDDQELQKIFFYVVELPTKTFLSGVGRSAALVKQIKDKLPKRVSNDPPNLVYFRTRTVYHYPANTGRGFKGQGNERFPRASFRLVDT